MTSIDKKFYFAGKHNFRNKQALNHCKDKGFLCSACPFKLLKAHSILASNV